jgi:hypothetical protein
MPSASPASRVAARSSTRPVIFAGRAPCIARQAAWPADGLDPSAWFQMSIYLWGRPSRASMTGRALGLGGRNPAGSRRGPVGRTPSPRVQEWHKCVRPVECKRGLSDGMTSGPRYADTPAGPRAGRLRRIAG